MGEMMPPQEMYIITKDKKTYELHAYNHKHAAIVWAEINKPKGICRIPVEYKGIKKVFLCGIWTEYIAAEVK
jgi:hypothetical protein